MTPTYDNYGDIHIDPYAVPDVGVTDVDEQDAESIIEFPRVGPIYSAGIPVYEFAYENPEAWRIVRKQIGEKRYAELRRLVADEFTIPPLPGADT
jgi:hypothetical protein